MTLIHHRWLAEQLPAWERLTDILLDGVSIRELRKQAAK